MMTIYKMCVFVSLCLCSIYPSLFALKPSKTGWLRYRLQIAILCSRPTCSQRYDNNNNNNNVYLHNNVTQNSLSIDKLCFLVNIHVVFCISFSTVWIQHTFLAIHWPQSTTRTTKTDKERERERKKSKLTTKIHVFMNK